MKTATYDRSAAFDPAASVFVSANAGAGKTSLLTDRVLRLLLHGADPSKLLCLTFTKAAAGEMSNRVLQELGKWVMATPEALSGAVEHLTGQAPDRRLLAHARTLFAQVLEAPEGLRIQTIHGFCQSLLKRFPIESGMSPHFSVMDERTAQELLAEARTRLFNRAQEGDEALQGALQRLAHRLNEERFGKLMGEIVIHKRKFQALLSSTGGIEHAVAQLHQALGLPEGSNAHGLFAQHLSYSDEQLGGLREVAGSLLASSKRDDSRTGAGLAAWLEAPAHGAKLESYFEVYLTDKGTPRKTLFNKGTLSEAQIEWLMAEQARVLALQGSLASLATLHHSTDVLHVAEALLSLYETIKRAHASIDYDDLILTASNLLCRPGIAPWVLFKLDGGIDHILVDEAQDTSAEQWTIIDALTQEFFAGQGRKTVERSLFVVGDEKQSIYSFQGADPAALGRKERDFSSRIKNAAMAVHKLELSHSYRSAPEVLQAVDAIFARDEARSGIMFSEGQLAHIPTRHEYKGLVELWPLVQREEVGEYTLSPHSVLARQIANTIHGWLTSGLWLESRGRAVQPGDIMVLVRTRTPFVDKLSRALKRLGVPVAGQDRMQLNENLAVQDLTALGQVLLLPEDDLTLAALLKSPICGISEEQLFALSWQRGQHSLWQRLQEAATSDTSVQEALNILEDLRTRADYSKPYELYAYALDTLALRRRITGRMGEEYGDPIDEFLNQALLYEQAHPASLQGFISWLTGSDSQIKRDMEQAHASIRIMTVHGAKGLQAPIVFVADTTSSPKLQDLLLWQDTLPLFAPSASRLDSASAQLKETKKQNDMAEYRRLLYVALTRAEDRLYICGSLSKGEVANEASWYHHARSGLASIANPFDMSEGQGLRLGEAAQSKPETLQSKAANETPTSNLRFLHRPAPQEPTPPKPLSPSRFADDEPPAHSPRSDAGFFTRGNVIHALLQHLPDIAQEKRQEAAKRIAAMHGHSLPETALENCASEALAVVENPEFAFLFGPDSQAEVPIAGSVQWDGQHVAIAGQIDRLYVGQSDAWIVDYKSHAEPPGELPARYRRQLQLYRLVLQQIYPYKIIRCAILWTSSHRLTIIEP